MNNPEEFFDFRLDASFDFRSLFAYRAGNREGRAPDDIHWEMPLATLHGDRYVRV